MPWHPIPGHIMTRWTDEVNPNNPWPEYPRPQMSRANWRNLNGLWQYTLILKKQDWPGEFTGQILVPFPIESALSGVKQKLQPDQRLWYRRAFDFPKEWQKQRLLLHFEAVDWETNVWVNGRHVGIHHGGYTPFTFDITAYIDQEEANELVVAVWDPSDKHWQPRGKQVLKPGGIWYSAVSGIWGTVWLEPVPLTYIETIKLTPDIDSNCLMTIVILNTSPKDAYVKVTAIKDQRPIAVTTGNPNEPIELIIPTPILWTPADPHLYDLEIDLVIGGKIIDRVNSYFGMRKFSIGQDQAGRRRLCLNNKPLFHLGPLDQGYWPDGLYTPPTEAAMLYDLQVCKELGFNMLRKHVKVEPARYYYHCDRIGLVVWQDMPNGGKAVGDLTSFFAILVGNRRRDDRFYARQGRGDTDSRREFKSELQELIDYLYNFTCIGMWIPFNEGWGQFDANNIAEWVKTYDPTRPVDHASGWFDQGGGDFISRHVYFKKLPIIKPDINRAIIISEYGGYGLQLSDHLWNPKKQFGYRKFNTKDELTLAYLSLLKNELIPWLQSGLSGAVYTQTTDVETEINGFLTYDRKVIKMNVEMLKEAHRNLYSI